MAYGNDFANVKKKKRSMTAMMRKLRDEVPTLVGYNLAGFDLHFILQKYLEDEVSAERFKLQTIYKGSSLIFFQVFDRVC